MIERSEIAERRMRGLSGNDGKLHHVRSNVLKWKARETCPNRQPAALAPPSLTRVSNLLSILGMLSG
ncbi:hypothetical protein RsS93_01730 [Rhizobium dioscoreae]|uniref:Uncharacterized protein n=1 Tax=Rhizobium dioscoreae TaxID=2653122 RepID=A0ABQ0YWZ3_9HYPH|nr:hypothetical protein RsS93_01730 [Rhizobium dioscoreae]